MTWLETVFYITTPHTTQLVIQSILVFLYHSYMRKGEKGGKEEGAEEEGGGGNDEGRTVTWKSIVEEDGEK